jgi:hypothetical protein
MIFYEKKPWGGEQAEEEGKVGIGEETQLTDCIQNAPCHRGLLQVQLKQKTCRAYLNILGRGCATANLRKNNKAPSYF